MLASRGAMPREEAAHQPLYADVDGFSLHAAVRVDAHDRARLEQLCLYITRPALSGERVQLDAAGQVEVRLKRPWRDRTTHLVMRPLEFMQRLAALVPRPRPHHIRFGFRVTSLREVSGPPPREHGVLAANAKPRALVVPQGSPEVEDAVSAAAAAARAAKSPKPGRTASAGRGCSSARSTSTCSTARTAAAGS
jgi:hypothetical protein